MDGVSICWQQALHRGKSLLREVGALMVHTRPLVEALATRSERVMQSARLWLMAMHEVIKPLMGQSESCVLPWSVSRQAALSCRVWYAKNLDVYVTTAPLYSGDVCTFVSGDCVSLGQT